MKAFATIEVDSRAALRRWLSRHHARSESVWLVTFKKTAGERYLPYDAIVEEALAFGWVDSLPRALDAERSMRLLSPRKHGSAWSKANKARVERLIDAGSMHAAGAAKVESAKADGSWSRLDEVETLRVPRDLAAALEREAKAARHFRAFPPSTRRAILEWIGNARTPATRAKRIEETARKAADDIRVNQYRQPKKA